MYGLHKLLPINYGIRGVRGGKEGLSKFVTHVVPDSSIDPKNTNKTPKIQVGTYLNVPRQVFENSGLPLTILLPVKKGITTVTINFLKAYSLQPPVGPVIISLARGLLR